MSWIFVTPTKPGSVLYSHAFHSQTSATTERPTGSLSLIQIDGSLRDFQLPLETSSVAQLSSASRPRDPAMLRVHCWLLRRPLGHAQRDIFWTVENLALSSQLHFLVLVFGLQMGLSFSQAVQREGAESEPHGEGTWAPVIPRSPPGTWRRRAPRGIQMLVIGLLPFFMEASLCPWRAGVGHGGGGPHKP